MDGLTHIFVSQRSRIVRLIQRIVGCPSTAEDIAQDTYLRLRGKPLGERDGSLLFKTAQNLALDHVRSRKVRSDHASLEAHQDADVEHMAPERIVAGIAELNELQLTLDTLPPRRRRIFLLQRIHGWTYPQIGRALGLSTSTVEKEMMLAMRVCRDYLRKRRAEDEGSALPRRCPVCPFEADKALIDARLRTRKRNCPSVVYMPLVDTARAKNRKLADAVSRRHG